MKPEEITRRSNEFTAKLCEQLMGEFGTGKDYKLAVAAASTTILFHAFRLGLHVSKDQAFDILRNIVQDMGQNLEKLSGIKIKFEVGEA